MNLRCLSAALWVLQVSLAAVFTKNESQWIVSGSVWNDDTGRRIQAHGGSFTRWEGQYFWFGEDREIEPGHKFLGISCYVSSDLLSWKWLGDVLKPTPNTSLDESKVIERPRVIYNKMTKTFVMIFHYDDSNYSLAKIGVATSKNISNGWVFKRAFSPLNSQSRDLSVFVDDDESAYVTFASDSNADLKMARMSKDYLDVEELVHEWKSVFWEATSMIKEKGTYYLIFSLQRGWDPNPNKAMHANNLAGPWSKESDIVPPQFNTFSSQNTYDLTVEGNLQLTHIFTGDRWVKDAIGKSTYIWQPLKIQDGEIKLTWYDAWRIDVKTGLVVSAQGQTYNPDPTSGHPGSVSFHNVRGTTTSEEAVQWCSIYYLSPGKNSIRSTISINGGQAIEIYYPYTSSTGVLSLPVPIKLLPGSVNQIELATPVPLKVEKIEVY